ncbi:MAG: TldD/PmbA family protein [Thermoplasmata archaeon]
MGDIRDHEDALGRVLSRLEPRTRFAEVLAQQTRGESVNLDSKSRRGATSPRLAGAVVRAWAGTHWVEAASSGFDPSSLNAATEALEGALTGATRAPPPGESATTVGHSAEISGKPMREMGMDRQLEWAQDIYRWASSVPGIQNAHVSVMWWDDDRFYLNTAGARCFQRVSRVRGTYAPITVENGRTEFDYDATGGVGGQEKLDELTEARVQGVAQGTVKLLGAKAPPTGVQNVLLDPGTTGTFAHESFGHGTEADQFVRNRSYLQPLLGQMVGPEDLTMIDDGSIPGGWGSVYFDDEGHPGHKTLLIDHGRFVGALHDRDSAGILGAKATGNTRRSDFLSRAFVRMTNMYVEPRDWTFEELVEEAGDGVILEHWTSGMEDPLGGQMQLKVRLGHRIEHGKVTDLVSSMALSGSVLGFLRDIRGIGDSTGFEMVSGFCGKGHGDYLPTGDAGPYLLSRAVVGPA